MAVKRERENRLSHVNLENGHYKPTLCACLCVGIPLVYELDKDLKPVKHYYLASDEEVKAAIDKVAAQGKAK